MNVQPTKRFTKSLKKLDVTDRHRVMDALSRFMENPRHPSLNFERVGGVPGVRTIRAGLSIRIFLKETADPNSFEIVEVGRHDLYPG